MVQTGLLKTMPLEFKKIKIWEIKKKSKNRPLAVKLDGLSIFIH
jgi:hypothetical protein